MITIERIYCPVNEFKLLYKALRFMTKQECYSLPQIKKYLEQDLTGIIDSFMLRWNYQKMPKDTINKLHRFAIAFRHNVVKGTK